jgi:hypothetical protein
MLIGRDVAVTYYPDILFGDDNHGGHRYTETKLNVLIPETVIIIEMFHDDIT